MSKAAISLLQADRDALLECAQDFGGRMSDEDSSTLAEYYEAISKVQKLMLDRDALLEALQQVMDDMDSDFGTDYDYSKARAAIDKAVKS